MLQNDIRLGDVVVSTPGSSSGGVLQYDMGKAIQGAGFHPTGFLNKPPPFLMSAVGGLKSMYARKGNNLAQAIDKILAKEERIMDAGTHNRPDPSSDMLYKSTKVHGDQAKSCRDICGAEPGDLAERPAMRSARDGNDPAIFYGLIASANQVMKDATIRDQLAQAEGVLCFEMEAAGLMNHFPCLVVRGMSNPRLDLSRIPSTPSSLTSNLTRHLRLQRLAQEQSLAGVRSHDGSRLHQRSPQSDPPEPHRS